MIHRCHTKHAQFWFGVQFSCGVNYQLKIFLLELLLLQMPVAPEYPTPAML